MSSVTGAVHMPPITIARKDFKYLSAYAKRAVPSAFSKFLKHELSRAHVVDEPGKKVVRLGSRVLYQDTSRTTPSSVTLVAPVDADIKRRRISVLTSIGTALLGLKEGQRIRFVTPWSGERTLIVLEVDNDDRRYAS